MADGEESSHFGPKVAGVGFALLLARVRERLTGAGASPDGLIVRPPSKSKSVGPSADARKKVDLSKADKISLREFLNVSLVNGARGNVAFADQLAQPCRGVGIVLVVKVHETTPVPSVPDTSTGPAERDGRLACHHS